MLAAKVGCRMGENRERGRDRERPFFFQKTKGNLKPLVIVLYRYYYYILAYSPKPNGLLRPGKTLPRSCEENKMK